MGEAFITRRGGFVKKWLDVKDVTVAFANGSGYTEPDDYLDYSVFYREDGGVYVNFETKSPERNMQFSVKEIPDYIIFNSTSSGNRDSGIHGFTLSGLKRRIRIDIEISGSTLFSCSLAITEI